MTHTAATDFSRNLEENFSCIFHHDDKNVIPVSGHFVSGDDFQKSKKRKAIDASESSSGYSTPPASENGITRQNSSGKGKKMKSNEKEEKKPKEMVHVRTKRGQATNSHSLAERVRRGKINERFRCLKYIVPGCYKTMGMVVMLDEIFNYVHSLQNQVEFLSMKLTATSNFYGFNSERDAIETLQDLAKLSQKFEENVLDATKKFEKLITDKREIEGLLVTALGLAAQTSMSKVFH